MILRYFKHFLLSATHWALTTSDDILVGGQAVIEGVMMRSPRGYSVAVRRPDGTLAVIKAVLRTPAERWRLFKLPVFRGVGVLGQALVLGIKSLRFSAEEAIAAEESAGKPAAENPREARPAEIPAWMMTANIALALGVNIALFIGLPLLLTGLLQRQLQFESTFAFNAIDGVFRVATFVAFLGAVSLMKDMRRVFEYHGAEHMTVFNFEARKPVTVENARVFPRLHPRCGTSFLFVLMGVSILVFSIAHFDGVLARLASRIVLLPLIAGLSYEVIRYSAKHPAGLLRAVTWPGLMLQKITTKRPDDAQLGTAIRALEESLTV